MAIDAAIMELQGETGWFQQLRARTGYLNAMSVYSCTPDPNRWVYPAASLATGLLARVLTTRTLRVAGVQWSVGSGAANYNANPPVGFWPEYMDAIAAKMSTHYFANTSAIALQRVYYDNSVLVIDAVDTAADVDMSEPYYYLSGFNANTPRIESMAFSCITAGLASNFFTSLSSNIMNVDQLFTALTTGPNRAVGFIGQGNFDAVSSMLPSSTTPSFVVNSADMAANVLSGSLVAGYVSEGAPPNASLFHIFETGIVSPRATSSGTSTGDAVTQLIYNNDGKLGATVIALIIVSAIALVLSVLLSALIFRERMGRPMFMPLLQETKVEAVKAQMEAKIESSAL